MSNFFSQFTGTGESVRGSRNPHHSSRKLHYEPLEERQMLSMTPLGQSADFQMPDNSAKLSAAYFAPQEQAVIAYATAVVAATSGIDNSINLGVIEGSTTLANLSLAEGEEAWFSFEIISSGRPWHEVSITSSEWADLDLELYDATGVLIGYSGNIGNNEAISLNNFPAGVYYASIYEYYSDAVSNYTLTIDVPLLASSSVTFVLIDETLYIEGTDDADWIEIEETATDIIVHWFDENRANESTEAFVKSEIVTIDFCGYGGNDTFINAFDGVSCSIACRLYGVEGNNTLIGGRGNDRIYGGTGHNILDGGDGDNIVFGGSGTNVFYNAGSGSNCFVWMGEANNAWADGHSLDGNDAHLIFSATTRNGNTYDMFGGARLDLVPWSQSDINSVMNIVSKVYANCGTYAFFRNTYFEDAAIHFVLSDSYDGLGDVYGYNGYGTDILFRANAVNSRLTIHEIAHYCDGRIADVNPFFEEFKAISYNADGTLRSDAVDNDFAFGIFAPIVNSPHEDWAYSVSLVLDGYGSYVDNPSDKWYQKANLILQYMDSLRPLAPIAPVELVVSDVTIPQEAVAGTSINVSWVIANIGELPTTESREIEVFLAFSPELPGWLKLATFDYSDILDPDASIPQTEQITIPHDLTGTFYVVVMAVGENVSIAWSTETIEIAAPTLAIAADKDSLKEGIEDGVTFTVTRTGNLSEDLVLTITTSDTDELTVPETVTILAGEESITFFGSSIQDFVKDGDKSVTITVTAEDFDAVTTVVTVIDVPPAELVTKSLTVPEQAVAGMPIDVSWIVANIGELPFDDTLWEILYITETGDLADGEILAEFFPTLLIDGDAQLERSETVTIPLHYFGEYQIILVLPGTDQLWAGNTITIIAPGLTVTSDVAEIKEGIEDGVTFTVTRTGNLSEDLMLTVTTSDETVLTVPETVTILAGEESVTFYGSSILHENGGGDRLVTVTVAAEDFDEVTSVITVLDLLPAELVIESLVVPEQVVAGTQMDVSWVFRNVGDFPYTDLMQGVVIYITPTGNLVDGEILDIIVITGDDIEGGAQRECEATVTIPLDYTGDYQIILVSAKEKLVSDVFEVFAPELIVISDVAAIDEGVEDGITFIVTRTGDLSEELVLTVTSSDTSKLTVPETVTILAGESEVTFTGSSVQTDIRDGNIPVIVTIAADNFETQSLEIVVLDLTTIEPVNTGLSVAETARAGTTLLVSWWTTNEGNYTSVSDDWTDNIYLSSDGTLENAILVGTFPADFQLEASESLFRTENITIPAGLIGDYCLVVETVYEDITSELVSADIQLFDGSYTLRLTMPELENVHWTILPTVYTYLPDYEGIIRNGICIVVLNDVGQLVFEDELEYLDGIEITATASYNSALTVDFSFGDWGMNQSLAFLGNPEQRNTLTLLSGRYGDGDTFHINGSRGTFNELQLAWDDVDTIVIDGKAGVDFGTNDTTFDTVTIISDETASAHFTVADNLFVMDNGGQRIEIVNVNVINAFGAGKHNSAYIYGENDSIIIMNDLFFERRSEDQCYRVWYAEQVTVINLDDANNAVLHTGSRGSDVYTFTEGYGTATNAVGSYSHEFIGFENLTISTPRTTPTVSLSYAEGWTQECDRGIWTQNDFVVTIMGNASIIARGTWVPPEEPDGEPDVPAPIIEPPMPSLLGYYDDGKADHKAWDESLCDFLAEEHARSYRKKDRWFGDDDEADGWLAEFEELALLELRK